MSKRLIIIAICLASLLAGTVLWLCLPEHGPRYQGKSLQTWFREYYTSQPSAPGGQHGPHLPSVRALQALGTNATPYLLKQCFAPDKDPVSVTNFLTRLSQVLYPLGVLGFVPAPIIQESAAEALHDIKPPARLLLPPLTNALAGTNRLQRQRALFLLGALGEGAAEATPWLAQGLRSTDPQERWQALNSVERLGPAVEGVLPELLTLLTNQPAASVLSWSLCRSLGQLGSNALPAAPLLKAKLQTETNYVTHYMLLTTLCRIDGQAEELHRLLEQLQQQTDTADFRESISLLCHIGPNARPAIPLLLKLLREDHKDLWYPAAQALKQLGAGKAEVLPILAEKMKDTNHSTRYSAAKLTLLFDPGNPSAVAVFLETVRTEPSQRTAAIGELGKLGPDAQAAIPLLREAAASQDKTVSETARRTLKHIERPAAAL